MHGTWPQSRNYSGVQYILLNGTLHQHLDTDARRLIHYAGTVSRSLMYKPSLGHEVTDRGCGSTDVRPTYG